MPQRYTVTVSVNVFAEDENEAKDKGLAHLYKMMEDDVSSSRPFNLDAEVSKD